MTKFNFNNTKQLQEMTDNSDIDYYSDDGS